MQRWQLVKTIPPSRHAIATNRHPGWGFGGEQPPCCSFSLPALRQLDLDRIKQSFDDYIREYARPSEETAFDNLVRTAQRDIDRGGTGFENHCGELRGKSFEILWRQDWFVIRRFKRMAQTPYNFSDQNRFVELVATGEQLLQADNIHELRRLVIQLEMIHIVSGSETEMLDVANIIRG